MSLTWSDVAPTVTAVVVVALGYATQLKLEKGRRRSAASENLQVLRRVECVRMMTASLRVIQLEPPRGMAEAALADLADADSTLELLGPARLSGAAHLLAESARKSWDTGGWDKYFDSRARFIVVARSALETSAGSPPSESAASPPPRLPTLS